MAASYTRNRGRSRRRRRGGERNLLRSPGSAADEDGRREVRRDSQGDDASETGDHGHRERKRPASTPKAPLIAQNHALLPSPNRTIPEGKANPITHPRKQERDDDREPQPEPEPSAARNAGDESPKVPATTSGSARRKRRTVSSGHLPAAIDPRPAPSISVPRTDAVA